MNSDTLSPKQSRFRSPITRPGYRAGISPPTKGQTLGAEELSRAELDALLAAMSGRSTIGKRARAIVALFYGANLKVGQAPTLRRRDYDSATGRVRVPNGQGRRGDDRWVQLDERSREHLDAWVEARRALGATAVWPLLCTIVEDRRGHPITAASIRNTLRGYADKAGIETRVTPEGLRLTHTAHRKERSEIATRLEEHLNSERFRLRYPDASASWRSALELVQLDAEHQATKIGHDCREALKYFANGVCARWGVEVDGQAGTHAKIRAALATGKTSSTAAVALLDALVSFWVAVSDYAQRQEHGAARETGRLTAEDGRRLLFQTMMVMYEIDRAMEELCPSTNPTPAP